MIGKSLSFFSTLKSISKEASKLTKVRGSGQTINSLCGHFSCSERQQQHPRCAHHVLTAHGQNSVHQQQRPLERPARAQLIASRGARAQNWKEHGVPKRARLRQCGLATTQRRPKRAAAARTGISPARRASCSLPRVAQLASQKTGALRNLPNRAQGC